MKSTRKKRKRSSRIKPLRIPRYIKQTPEQVHQEVDRDRQMMGLPAMKGP